MKRKQTVKTRKNHECYGCAEIINKGDSAVYVRGKEDDLHVNFHMHEHCHITATKRKLYEEGIVKGAVNQMQEEYSTTDIAAYPF